MAVAAGYLLGRTKRMKMAPMLGQLLSAARDAAVTAASRRIDSLNQRLSTEHPTAPYPSRSGPTHAATDIPT